MYSIIAKHEFDPFCIVAREKNIMITPTQKLWFSPAHLNTSNYVFNLVRFIYDLLNW